MIRTQIRSRIIWYFTGRENPKPSWYYSDIGWIDDPEEIKRSIMLDDTLGLAQRLREEPRATTDPAGTLKENQQPHMQEEIDV
jgi:hypothetical protein